ncbi:hypothetical protein BJX96DRAFT_162960 [Aspergillus floccosus]
MMEKQLLAAKVDTLADQLPDQVYCVHPISSSPSDGWRNITYSSLADATNFLAWWIEEKVPDKAGQTLAYIGANDARYIALILACMKTGHPVLLLSGKNSKRDFDHLLSKTDCTTLIVSQERDRVVREMLEDRTGVDQIQTLEILPLWTVFSSKAAPYSFNLQYSDVEDQTTVIIHTSGTTGVGKYADSANAPGRKSCLFTVTSRGRLRLNMGPFFHFLGLTPFVQCPDCPMTAQMFASIVAETQPHWMITTPSFLQDLARTKEGLSALCSFKEINYGGAPLSPECGGLLSKKVHLQTGLAASETGYTASLQSQDRRDWDCFEWNPAFGVHMDNIGDDVFELVIPRHESRDFHGIFHTLPELTEYRTGDLFVAHPTKAEKWKYYGRRDDIIVLNNGEMFNPIEMEKIVEEDPHVSKAIIVGQGRFEAALLIEPDWGYDGANASVINIVQQVLPTVERANKISPRHGRILPNRILLTSEMKPFKVTPKGTVKRRLVEADYHNELEELYTREDTFTTASLPQSTDYGELETYIRKTVSCLAHVESVDEEHDIFGMGLDSLHALQLSDNFRGVVRRLRPDQASVNITIEDIYLRPTVRGLAQFLCDMVSGRLSPASAEVRTDVHSRAVDVIDRLSRGWGKQYTVLLTGSTGVFGTYIRIVCLIRSNDAPNRQWRSLRERGLNMDPAIRPKVQFLQADLADAQLGLCHDEYEDLVGIVDMVLHNAWLVNFKAGLDTFEYPHLLGVRHLIEFVMRGRKKPRLHFVSSVAALGAWPSGTTVPEKVIDNADAAPVQGYGLSKYISEHVINKATQECGISGCIYRVGQLAGPTTQKGSWNRHEWLPSLILTSKAIGKLPQSLGSMQDIAARGLVELMHSCADRLPLGSTPVFNLVNPKPALWETLLPTLQTQLGGEVVSLDDWVKALEPYPEPTQHDLEDKPALKLLDFFRSLCSGDKSPPHRTIKELGPIDSKMMRLWLMQWGVLSSR